MLNICRGVANQDDFYTVGSLVDFGVVAFALVGNRIKSKSMLHPFFAIHASCLSEFLDAYIYFQLILSFFLSVITVLLFIKIYEKNEQRRQVSPANSESKQSRRPDNSPKLLLFFYILILLLHAYALKVGQTQFCIDFSTVRKLYPSNTFRWSISPTSGWVTWSNRRRRISKR